ncbi:MAG: AraC family ligand binding domain-containing protein [Pseudomonadota bacterium]
MTRTHHGRLCCRCVADGAEVMKAFGLRSGYALPGQAFVLYPDELHDGRPCGLGGYSYRAVHLAPRIVSASNPSGTLPFVAEAC